MEQQTRDNQHQMGRSTFGHERTAGFFKNFQGTVASGGNPIRYHLRHGVPANPIANVTKAELVQTAVDQILAMERFTQNDIASVLPPVDEMLT